MKSLMLFVCMVLTSLSVEAAPFETEVTNTVVHKVYFDLDKSKVKPSEKELIEKLTTKRLADFDGSVVIVGATDNRASEAYNSALGLRRATAVASILGIDSASVSSIGEQEATGNHNLDRNVEVRLMSTSVVYNPIFDVNGILQGPNSTALYNVIPVR